MAAASRGPVTSAPAIAAFLADRQFRPDLCAAPRRGGDGQATTDQFHPLVHAPDTEMAGRSSPIPRDRYQPPAVVAHFDADDLVVAGQDDLQFARPGMLYNVR